MRVTGPEDFARAMRFLAANAPGELDDVMQDAARAVLPMVRARGGSQTTVGLVSRKGAVFRDPRPYAWAQHGAPQPLASNSQTWWAVSRVGKSLRQTKIREGGLKGIPRKLFVTDTLEDNQVVVNRELERGLNRLLEKHLS